MQFTDYFHLEEDQNFVVGEGEARLSKNIHSTLTVWFKLNEENFNARQL